MRLTLSLLAGIAAAPAYAEDVFVRADVTEAVVYFEGARVTRTETLSLEAGMRRVLLPASGWGDRVPVFDVEGAMLVQTELLNEALVPGGALDTGPQATARTAVTQAEDVLETAEQALQSTLGQLSAIELQLDYLSSLVAGGEDGLAMPESAEALDAVLSTLGATAARLAEERVAFEQEVDAREVDIEAAEEALALAERALDDLRPIGEDATLWALTLEVPEAREVIVEMSDQADARWEPSYDLHLDSETGALRLEREITLFVDSDLPWEGVVVTLSTSDPRRALAPQDPFSSVARIQEPIARDRVSVGGMLDAAPSAPMMEPVAIMEDRSISPSVEGLTLSYPVTAPVTIGPDGVAFLDFGAEAFDAQLINRAVPRADDTAFLIADVVNESGAPILPGAARIFRDGSLISDSFLPLIAPGEAFELPFGPLDHIQLTWTDLSRDTGDRGVFVSSNTQEQRLRLDVDNLSDELVEVELLYPTPVTEQEDLAIEIVTSAPPAQTAWKDRRGVYAWALELAPESSQSIELDFSFRWPEGQELIWRH